MPRAAYLLFLCLIPSDSDLFRNEGGDALKVGGIGLTDKRGDTVLIDHRGDRGIRRPRNRGHLLQSQPQKMRRCRADGGGVRTAKNRPASLAAAISAKVCSTLAYSSITLSPFGGQAKPMLFFQTPRSFGHRTARSSYRLPSQSPAKISRRPRQGVTVRPRSAAAGATVCMARLRSLL